VRPGDLIIEVNGTAIKDLKGLMKALEADENDGVWQVAVDRNGRRLSRTVRL